MSQPEAAVCLRSEYSSQCLKNALQKRHAAWKIRGDGGLQVDHSTLALHWADFSSLAKTWEYLLNDDDDEEAARHKQRLRVSCVYVKCGLVRKVTILLRQLTQSLERLLSCIRATCTSG
jgi:hypothetical protein